MEIYKMMRAGGYKTHLVIIEEGAYEKYTLQEIEHMVVGDSHVLVSTFVNGDTDISEVCLVDESGIFRRIDVEED